MRSGRLFLLMILLLSSLFAGAVNPPAFDSANSAYSRAEFEKAAQLYEEILKGNSEASEVYFNLGNAYYKTGNIAKAILNYERALRLKPEDEDIAYNLQLANQRTEDKIEAAPEMFLSQWKSSIADLFSERTWSLLCIVSLTIALLLFFIYYASRRRALKQAGFFGGGLLLILCICSFLMGNIKLNEAQNSYEGIITAASVTVSGSPSEQGTRLFIIHEGCKVQLLQQTPDWTEVKIANGNVGWIRSTQLEKI